MVPGFGMLFAPKSVCFATRRICLVGISCSKLFRKMEMLAAALAEMCVANPSFSIVYRREPLKTLSKVDLQQLKNFAGKPYLAHRSPF